MTKMYECVLSKKKHDESSQIFAQEVGNHNRLLNICTGSTKDQCIEMEIVHVFVNESSYSSWTKLLGNIGSIQEHELRGNSEYSISHRN